MTTSTAWVERLNDPDVVLGAHVNSLRFLKRCTQADLGEVLGIGQSTMGKKLRGEVGISFAELLKLAAFFELAVEDMIPTQFAGQRRLQDAAAGQELPRLDSNQQPSGYLSAQVINLAARRAERAA